MKVLVTGASGFIARNLRLLLAPRDEIEIIGFDRSQPVDQLPAMLEGVDFVFHLAGVNRPHDPAEFMSGNVDVTVTLCQALARRAVLGARIPVIYTSSIQAAQSNPYGDSKCKAEEVLFSLGREYSKTAA